VADRVLAESASTASTSPSFFITCPSASLADVSFSMMSAEFSSEWGPKSQSTCKASFPWMAAQVPVATTASPEGISSTERTPEIFRVPEAS